jgi:hypothetical protein
MIMVEQLKSWSVLFNKTELIYTSNVYIYIHNHVNFYKEKNQFPDQGEKNKVGCLKLLEFA